MAYVPGAGAEQIQQAAAAQAGWAAATAGAQYCTWRKNPVFRRFSGDTANPQASLMPNAVSVAVADAVAPAPASLPGVMARWGGR